MQGQVAISAESVRAEVRKRYHDVARNSADQHCHTGRPLAARVRLCISRVGTNSDRSDALSG